MAKGSGLKAYLAGKKPAAGTPAKAPKGKVPASKKK